MLISQYAFHYSWTYHTKLYLDDLFNCQTYPRGLLHSVRQRGEAVSRGSLRATGRADVTKHCFVCFTAELGAGLRVLKVDLVVARVKTCWILSFPKALHRMSFLEELSVHPRCSSCHPTLALPMGQRTSSCQRYPDHHTFALLRPLYVLGHCFKAGLPAFWPTADVFLCVHLSFTMISNKSSGACTSEDKVAQNKDSIHHRPSACFQNQQCLSPNGRDIFCACFNRTDKMMIDPL